MMMRKRVRVMSDGVFVRLFRGGFGATFPLGPYETLEDAVNAPDNFWEAVDALVPGIVNWEPAPPQP